MAPSKVSCQRFLATVDQRVSSILQQRQKWNNEQINLAENDIVLVLDERTPRSSWPLGRVVEVHTNRRDGLVRSAKIKTSSNVLVRPIDKIILLEASSLSCGDERQWQLQTNKFQTFSYKLYPNPLLFGKGLPLVSPLRGRNVGLECCCFYFLIVCLFFSIYVSFVFLRWKLY